MRLSFYLKTND